MNARELALLALRRSHDTGGYVQDELHALMAAHNPPAAEKGLAMEIAQGTVRHRRTLDYLLGRLLERPIGRMPALARLVLETGAYQILFLDRVPDYAVVDEAVTLMRRQGNPRLAGLANAVLRGLAGLVDHEAGPEAAVDVRRRLPSPHGGQVILKEPTLPADALQRLGVATSFPDVLVRRWVDRWGASRAQQVMEALNRPPRVFARVNRMRSTVEDVLARLPEPLPAECPPVRDNVLDVTSLGRDRLIKLLDAGLVTVEDPTAMSAVEALGIEPGQSVLDLCAAPGGKTSYIAELLAGQGTVVALDRPGARLELLRETLRRLGLENVRIAPNEPGRTPDGCPERFDRVLVDVPCSNTGVLNRRAEARWRFGPAELRSLTTLQAALLNQAAAATAVGGLCVYSTCSLEPEENEQLVGGFLEARPWMVLQAEQETLPSDREDGGYFARLIRAAEA